MAGPVKPYASLPPASRSLPGRQRFDLSREVLGSRVEAVVADFMRLDTAELGRFDVVLFLGVLYHLESPLEGLYRLAQVTGDLAVIETEAVAMPGYEDRALCEFFESDELQDDPTNWWVPNMRALLGMCRAAGFASVEPVQGPPQSLLKRPLRYRAVVHAHAHR